MKEKITKSEQDWKQELTDEQYRVLRQKGTERAYTGKFYLNKEKGLYICGGCGNELFSSDTKFDSGCGWPSFYAPVNSENVRMVDDTSYGMKRIEVVCNTCDGHLGHVFNDAPQTPTGLRFCINSVSLDFDKQDR